MKLAELDENMAHCWRCNHCKWVHSPKSNEFAHACPSIQYGNFHNYSGGGKVITAYGLAIGDVTYTDTMLESVFACTMCGGCDVSCKINNGELVEPLEILYALRERIVDDGQSLPAHQAIARNLRDVGNPTGQPRDARAHWADGLGIKDATREPVAVLLHVGCDSSYDPALWPELRAIVTLLRRAGVDFGIAYDAETASGEVAFDLGYQADARVQAQHLAGVIAATGAPTVVTCSAGSYSAFRYVWPRLGVQLAGQKLWHITEFVDDLIERGALVLDGRCDATVTYHDPCKLGRLSEEYTPQANSWTRMLNTIRVHADHKPVLFGNDGLYEAPRRLLARLDGLKLVEMERNRISSYCCGAKGGAREAYPQFADFAAGKRLAEAAATGASVVATACGGCQRHLKEAAAASDQPLAIVGIFELLAAASEGGPS